MTDASAHSLEHPFHRACRYKISFKKPCVFFFFIISLVLFISVVFSLIIIFILKPRRPIFSFQTMNVASYKFDVFESSTVVVSTVASATLNTQNPNKVGIGYDFSRLRILNDGLVVGMIRIPEFYQPAGSHNVSIKIDIMFQYLDITTIMSGVETNNFTIKVLGDIGVRLWLLPKMKVGLDCDVAVDSRYLTSVNDNISRLKAAKNHIAQFDANSQAFSKKCSISFYL